MSPSRLHGVIAAAATPLAPDHSIDTERLVAHCRRLLQRGCDGINLLGTTGEATSFSVQQRLQAMQAVAKSGLPLGQFMVGTGAAALEDAVTLTAAAHDLSGAGAGAEGQLRRHGLLRRTGAAPRRLRRLPQLRGGAGAGRRKAL